MTSILVIRSSAGRETSVTNQLTDHYLAAIARHDPSAQITQRDVDADPIPHVTAETLAGIGRPAPTTPDTEKTRALSDTLIAEVFAADTLVIAMPMYNFGMPSTLKSWFDHVLRAGTTFQYSAAGPEGLVTGKQAVIIAARAGAYAHGGPEHQVSHVQALLNFIGITEIEVILAEGLAMGADQAEAAIGAARTAIDRHVEAFA